MTNQTADMDFLGKAIAEVRATSFASGYEASDAECLGIAIATYFKWNGAEIVDTTLAALTDANYHTLASNLEALYRKNEADAVKALNEMEAAR